MSATGSLLEARPLTVEGQPGTGETHICDLANDLVALCGYRRTKPLRAGDPATGATCMVCLDLYAMEQSNA